MLSLKIECPCGQHYAFEVEPIMGRMPASIACPACGADGTDAANELISRTSDFSEPAANTVSLFSSGGEGRGQETSAHQVGNSLGASRPPVPAPATRRSPAVPGLPSRTQVLFEARAKISWGDSPQDALKYLIIQGFTYEEAAEAVQGMVNERAAAIRQRGFVYMIGGGGMMCIPIVTWLGFLHAGVIYPRFLIVTIFVGLAGIGVLIKGIFLFITPNTASGDVAEQ